MLYSCICTVFSPYVNHLCISLSTYALFTFTSSTNLPGLSLNYNPAFLLQSTRTLAWFGDNWHIIWQHQGKKYHETIIRNALSQTSQDKPKIQYVRHTWVKFQLWYLPVSGLFGKYWTFLRIINLIHKATVRNEFS